jgi:hypothetical protein
MLHAVAGLIASMKTDDTIHVVLEDGLDAL